jgi:hypothetical protein
MSAPSKAKSRLAGRLPADLARIEFARIGAELRADAKRPRGERLFLGVSPPVWLDAAGRVLEAIAAGMDHREIIDGRIEGLPRQRAIDAFLAAWFDGARSKHDAMVRGAAEIGISTAMMKQHVRDDEIARGVDYLMPRRKKLGSE